VARKVLESLVEDGLEMGSQFLYFYFNQDPVRPRSVLYQDQDSGFVSSVKKMTYLNITETIAYILSNTAWNKEEKDNVKSGYIKLHHNQQLLPVSLKSNHLNGDFHLVIYF
jgi:hypothetical protein